MQELDWDPKYQPKLGGFGIIVEMDESYFSGQPKFNRGRRLSTTWSDDEKWVFGLTPRNSLDRILPSNRSRKSLLPVINKHCLEETWFCSDWWKAYNCLADHLELADILHYHVNHSKNYEDPDTGAHSDYRRFMEPHKGLSSFSWNETMWSWFIFGNVYVTVLQTASTR